MTGIVRAVSPSSLLFDLSVADCFEGDVFILVRVLAVELEEADRVLVIPHSESSMYSCGLREHFPQKYPPKKATKATMRPTIATGIVAFCGHKPS